MDEDQTAKERMDAVERQVHKHIPKGVRRSILCPYCGKWNFHDGSILCCDLLRKAILAVLIADRMMDVARAGEKEIVH